MALGCKQLSSGSLTDQELVDLESPQPQGTDQLLVDVIPQDLQHQKYESRSQHHDTFLIPDKIIQDTSDKEEEDESCSSNNSSDNSSFSVRRLSNIGTFRITVFLLALGLAVSAGFLALGISAAFQTQEDDFDRNAVDLVNKIATSWHEYENAAALIHGRFRNRNFSRQEFRDFYEYLIAGGLSFQAAQFDPNITHGERDYYENEAREYYETYYPHFEYRGFIGFENASSTTLTPRSVQDFYFPIHYMEPVEGNEAACGLDYHASGSRKATVLYCMNNRLPALTDRLRLVQEQYEDSFGVVLMHPGYELSNSTDSTWPRDLASIVIRIPDLLRRATENQAVPAMVYLYDNDDSRGDTLFLGAVEIRPTSADGKFVADLRFLKEKELEDLQGSAKLYREFVVFAANKHWTVAVVAPEGSFEADYAFVLVGGVVIFLATTCLAFWVRQNTRRVASMNRLKAESEAEKAALILESARTAAHAERELNDFIAHEVRNPVAAAMSACSFVQTELKKKEPLKDEKCLTQMREDVGIVDNALKFVNDLLRNMLDMHRASNKKLKVSLTPTDILHDVLEPVQSMLMQRGGKVDVQVVCEEGLFALADRLRLNQVMLNLGRNSAKFVDEGYIRLSAKPFENGLIQLTVEDSGPGIPESKKCMLFQKYQESLDLLSQGTGIGLFLCQNLVELMDGQIYLDEDYDSGLPGRPGSRFVVELKAPPGDFLTNGITSMLKDDGKNDKSSEVFGQELPKNISVLFVDDDPILRKLFSRTLRTVAPDWKIREASNGETALQLVEANNNQFDLIFMDMYMAAVEKQLLGTEAVEELRHRGVKCRICGLSANDKEMEFLAAGADAFCFKPFPCEKVALRQELSRVLCAERGSERNVAQDHEERKEKHECDRRIAF